MVDWTMARQESRSARSVRWAITSPPAARISSATDSRVPALRAPIASFAPFWANCSAISRPSPGPMPVMTATFPLSSISPSPNSHAQARLIYDAALRRAVNA